MTVQLSVGLRNNRLDGMETFIGADAILEIRTDAQPADCAAADSGTLLASMTLPSDWMAAASGGSKAKSGTWEDTSADAAGTAAHWRLKTSGGVCVMQGSITSTLVGTGDLLLDNVSVAAGQKVSISTFTWTDGGA